MGNRQIVLNELPQGKLSPDHFRLAEGETPSPSEGEVLVRTRYISLDAANRAWMQGATYRSALTSGQVMAGGALAEVVESRAPGLAAGDLVFGDTGWQDYAVLSGQGLSKLPALSPLTHLLSVYGVAGLTAYFGLLECGRPKAGETVVVSAAAGSVGSIVGQIARIKGCKVIGVAGGAEKCAWLTDELGFDAAIDYKAEKDLTAALAAATSGIGAPTPGWNRFTITRPSAIEIRLAVMNHASARVPIRPSAELSPICAIPTTMVESTSGATSILMRLRKISDSSLNQGATCSLISAGSTVEWSACPTTTPSAMPIRM